MEIREAVAQDLERIQELNKKMFEEEIESYNETFNGDWSMSEDGKSYYEERIAGEDCCAFVLVDKEIIVGYLVGSLIEGEFYRNVDSLAELDDMYILAEHRGKSFGSKLYEKFVEWCKEKGIKRLKVSVTAQNKQGIGFYRKNGFKDYSLDLERDI